MHYKSNAKINFGLRILDKRNDGYHNLESVFIPIPWYDDIKIVLSKEFEIELLGKELDIDWKENLCYKAYALMKENFNIRPIKISLKKNIPSGAGLGGGSSNAAFTILAINDLFSLKLSKSTLANLADKIGSDCSFFIYNEASLVEGKGERVTPIPFNFSDWVLVINPSLHISTKEAFNLIKPQQRENSLIDLIKAPKKEWFKTIENDFEDVIIDKYPQLEGLKNILYEKGAYYISLSGSGSSFFAFFEEEPKDLEDLFPDYPKRIFRLNL